MFTADGEYDVTGNVYKGRAAIPDDELTLVRELYGRWQIKSRKLVSFIPSAASAALPAAR